MFESLLNLLFFKRKDPFKGLTIEKANEILKPPIVERPSSKFNEPLELKPHEYFVKTGTITHYYEETNEFKIDDCYKFKSDLNNLFIGTKVSYRLLNFNEISNVNVIENDWEVIEVGKKTWHNRVIVCQIINKEERFIYLKPNNIKVDLNKVSSDFLPTVGDWIELHIKCETKNNLIDVSCDIVEIDYIKSIRQHVVHGCITAWDNINQCGIIDGNIYFCETSLSSGYFPIKSDKVIAEVVESEQGICCWRAIKVVPNYFYSSLTLKQPLPKHLFEEFIDSHPDIKIDNVLYFTFDKFYDKSNISINIKNESKKNICLKECIFIKGNQCSINNFTENHIIGVSSVFTLNVECIAKNLGHTREILVIIFDNNIKIKRWIDVYVETHSKVEKSCSYTKLDRLKFQPCKNFTIKGSKLNKAPRFVNLFLPDYSVPKRLLQIYRNVSINNYQVIESVKPCLTKILKYHNYEEKFHTLLHLNEISNLIQIQQYNSDFACFVRNKEYFMLEVENLSERRPSIIIGDRIIATDKNNDEAPDYEGYVHKVTKNHVYLKFNSYFHNNYKGEDYSIKVIPSRSSERKIHYAINLAIQKLNIDILFPYRIIENETMNYINSKDEINWYNKKLNEHQKNAIFNILLGKCRPMPYIIFGPPGTGKTITIIETILQILQYKPHSRILLTAPSNSAADLLAIRLIETNILKPGEIIRLIGLNASNIIDPILIPYVSLVDIAKANTVNEDFYNHDNNIIRKSNSIGIGRHRVTISTCTTAANLFFLKLKRGHFSHIIIDEAGQTTEPVTMIPLSFLDINSGQCILSGDPLQLGSVVSQISEIYGLQISYLERIINRFPYIRDPDGFPLTNGYDPRLVTKLLYNYRALPNLVNLASKEFYNNELIPTIDPVNSHEATMLKRLSKIFSFSKTNYDSCIIFHGMVSENYQNENSPSWFNPKEAAQVFFYLNEIYRLGLKSSDVGIITPYKAQSELLKKLLNEANFEHPKIGTVEDFQGQEFNIIIISVVRSSEGQLNMDSKFCLGFISSPKRINVAITRAKVFLIIIGNPKLLYNDIHWRLIIDYCTNNNTYIGCELD